MTIFNFRLPVSQALSIADDIDNSLNTAVQFATNNVVPTAPATADTLDLVNAAAVANASDTYIVSLVTDKNNPIMEPYLAGISEAFDTYYAAQTNLFFRYVAL